LSSYLKYADIFPEQLTRTFSLSSNTPDFGVLTMTLIGVTLGVF
jgi:hypothetical protein